MNVVQSFLTTIIKGDFSLYEVRIFMRIVELANSAMKGQRVTSKFGQSFCADGINWNLTIPIKDILSGESHHYDEVRNALENLQTKIFKMYFPEEKEWRSAALLDNIRIADGSGCVRFVVPTWLIEYILNFVEGNFSEYDLQSALSLPSSNSVRLYWLTCSMTRPVTYSIQMLKDILGVGSSYPSTKDFIKRCIEPPRKILQERNLNGFTAKKVMRKNKIIALELSPVKRQTMTATQLTARAPVSSWCEPSLRQYLMTQANINIPELSKHKDNIFKFTKLDGWQDKIVKIVNRARKGRKGKGYIFAAIKNEVAESEHPNEQLANKFRMSAHQLAEKMAVK